MCSGVDCLWYSVRQESPLLNLLGQSSSLPWDLVDHSSYENVTGYVNTHYPSSLILSHDASSQQVVKLLKMAAGFGPSLEGKQHGVSWSQTPRLCTA